MIERAGVDVNPGDAVPPGAPDGFGEKPFAMPFAG